MRSPSIIILMDSFKGSLSSMDAVRAVQNGLTTYSGNLNIKAFPLADGGEGSLDVLESQLQTTRYTIEALDPHARPCKANYLIDDTGHAFIELAQASGLHFVTPTPTSALISTTYGTGQAMHHAIRNGAKEVSVLLGGSATSDCGIGMLQALGCVFFDEDQTPLLTPLEQQKKNGKFTGIPLTKIASFTVPSELQQVQWRVIVDVNNPLTGPQGAAHIYGPQKGADPKTVNELNDAHNSLATVVENKTGKSYSTSLGSGAAGGTAFALLALLGAEKVRGPAFFLNLIDFESHLQTATLLITGEGCLDSQSLKGKLLLELIERTKERDISLVSLCGAINLSIEELEEHPHLYAFGLGHVEGLSKPEKALEVLSYQIGHIFVPLLHRSD